MIDVKDIEAAARGKWAGIFSKLGIDVGTGKHGPCPICSPGDANSDRFRFDDADGSGSWYCNQCTPNAGNGISLVKKCLNLSFPDTLKKIADIVGDVTMPDTIKKSYDARGSLIKLWNDSQELTGSDPVSGYLQSRKLFLHPDNVMYCEKCYNSDTKQKMPAMVAKFQNQEGKPITIHRTYLDGIKKADLKAPKKIMKPTEKMNGGAVRLFKPGGELFSEGTLGIAEGIETAIAAAQLTQVATWAALTSGLLIDWEPPPGIRKIIIFGDNDGNFTGQKAAYTLANRLSLKNLIVTVDIPGAGDWADVVKTHIL